MANSFDLWLQFAWRPENDGQGFHCDANDPGGNTNRGVTQKSWDDAVEAGYVTGSLQEALTADLSKVLHTICWNACQCDQLPAGIDIMVADMAMVAGSGASASCLQRIVGAKPDGEIGPLTLKAVDRYHGSYGELLSRLWQADDAYYESLRQFRLWGRGWERRASDCRTFALQFVFPSEK